MVRKTTVMGKEENRGTKGRDLPLLTPDISHTTPSAKQQEISQVSIQPEKLFLHTLQLVQKHPVYLVNLQDQEKRLYYNI